MELRNSKKVAITGRSGAGKSVTAEKLVEQMMKARQKKSVVAHDPQGRFGKYATHYVNSAEDLDFHLDIDNNTGRTVMKTVNAIFVFDESQMLWGRGQITQNIIDILALSREYGNDIIFVTHHPRLIPPKISMYLTDIFVFTTGSGSKTFNDNRLEGAETLMHCMEAVKDYVKEYPKGAGGLGEYPVFPFVHFDVDKQVAAFINMPEIDVSQSGENVRINYVKHNNTQYI